MATVYIIGNGFDLWHNLSTSYACFYDFAKETLCELENYYVFDVSQSEPWHDFENALGCFDCERFYQTHNHIDVKAEDFRPSFAFGLEDDLNEQADQHVKAIRECFRDWVTGIDMSMANRRMVFSNNARFINFNYTSTLQSIYDISDANILHIHGRADSYDELVFGHGETREEEPELDENGESNRTIFSDAQGAAKYPFYALQKPVDEVLKQHQNFFGSLHGATEIIVIGHSLNKIDLPYFRKICEQTRSASWKICVYKPDDNEKFRCKKALIECGVPPERINFCSYTDLEVKHLMRT